jgi:hypothetical protein
MFEQMIPGDPFDMMRILLAKEDGVTEIEETTGPYTPAFTPKKGTAVNYCEAKKLIHFLKYRHLHPAHKWPKKNKGGGTALLKAGSAGVEVDRDYEHDLNDDAEAVRQFETEYLFDLRKVALKRDYKVKMQNLPLEYDHQSSLLKDKSYNHQLEIQLKIPLSLCRCLKLLNSKAGCKVSALHFSVK